jgi:hypothetical protein
LSALLAACAQTLPPQVAAPSASSPPPAPPSGINTIPGSGIIRCPPSSTGQPEAAKSAPADHIVNIRGASCQDLLRLSPEDSATASMFYIGYQASRFRTRTINVGVIPSIEAQAVTYC